MKVCTVAETCYHTGMKVCTVAETSPSHWNVNPLGMAPLFPEGLVLADQVNGCVFVSNSRKKLLNQICCAEL